VDIPVKLRRRLLQRGDVDIPVKLSRRLMMHSVGMWISRTAPGYRYPAQRRDIDIPRSEGMWTSR
jgi:hypothetical protein